MFKTFRVSIPGAFIELSCIHTNEHGLRMHRDLIGRLLTSTSYESYEGLKADRLFDFLRI